MMTTTAFTAQEIKDRKRAKRISASIFAVLLIVLALPLLTQTVSESPKYEQVISIEFNDFKSAAAKSSTKAATPRPTKVVEKPKPVEEPKAKPTKTASRKPVLKTPEPKAPVIKEAPVVKEKPVETPKEEVIEEPTPEETFEEIETVEETTTETTSENREGTSGTSNAGNAETDGKADKGDGGMDFSGDGLFSRRVVHRAEIQHLTKESGKIVINLCVNQGGRVVYTEFNKEESTIATPDLIREAIQATIKYRFEKDYTASTKQCGKLSFVFEIEN